LAATLLAMTAVGAEAQTPAPISVENAWARATSASAQAGAAYVTIIGHGASDRLIGVSTPVAAEAVLHETIQDGDVMKMQPVDGLDIPANASVKLAPGGYHIMLMHLRQPLKRGDSFPLSLRFQNAGTIETKVTVQAPGAGAPMPMGGSGHDMHMPGMDKP